MLRQFYYTSCQNGLGTSSGYQFNAATPGIEQDTLRAAQALVSYEPPPSAPAQPSSAELDGFPVALSYSLIAPASALVCRSVYIGRDYSGRFGNFFAHGLHLDPTGADLGGACPIDLWESPLWSTTETISTQLPPLEPLVAGSAVGDADLAAFLDAGGRRGQLYPFLVAVRQALEPGGRQIVLVEETSAEAALWVALASRSLPRRLALQLTFTTYTRRPYYATHRLIGITPDADFRFSPSELNVQYMVFDFVGRRFSDTGHDEWASVASTFWASGSRATMAQFHDFLSDSGLADVPTDLGAALAAFGLARGCEVTDHSLRRAIRWADGNADNLPREFWRAFARQLEGRTSAIELSELGTIAARWSRGPQASVAGGVLQAYSGALVHHVASGGATDNLWLPDRLVAGLDLNTGDVVAEAIARRVPLPSLTTLLRLLRDLDQPVEAAILERLGRERLGPDVIGGLVSQDEVLRLVEVPAGAAVGAGLVGHLEDVAAADIGDAGMAQILSGPLGAWVNEQELDDASPLGPATLVNVGRGDARQRVPMLDLLIDHYDRGEPVGDPRRGAVLDRVLELLWQHDPVTASDARRILEIIPLEDVAVSGRVGWLAKGVTCAQELTPDVSRLALRLHEEAAQLGLAQVDVDILGIVLDSRTPRATPVTFAQIDLLVNRAAKLEPFDAPITRALLDDVADMVLRLQGSSHAEVLLAAVASSRRRFLDAYRRRGAELPAPSDPSWARAVGERFMVWTWLVSVAGKPLGDELLNDLLAPAAQTVGPDDLGAVENYVGLAGTSWAKDWQQWLGEARNRRRGFHRRSTPKAR